MHNKPLIITISFLLSALSLAAQHQKYDWGNLPKAQLPVFKRDTFNIRSYGARPDGLTINTVAINRAIEDCNQKGGGVVVVPQGVWLTGPIQLKSNVNLHVARAALLQFTDDKRAYALVEGSFEGQKTVRNQSPVYGENLENIAITGDGVLDGNGEVWRAMKKDKATDGEWKTLIASGGVLSQDGRTWYPSEGYRLGEENKSNQVNSQRKTVKDFETVKDFLRPNMIVLNSCKKVLLQNATFQNSPAWCLHMLSCENLTIDGVRVRNLPSAQNGDGLDMESCSYVEVKNSTLDCGDDGLCIKSGKDEEGRRAGKPCQYITISNNVVYRAHGGFVIGSEMSGGAHDIYVTDCTFIGTDIGLRFKTARGRGGIVENIFIRNISMHNIVHDAISFDMYYFAKVPTLAQTGGKVEQPPVGEGTPQFRNFFINNLVCEGAERAMLIRGLPEMSIKNIYLKDFVIKAKKGADIIEASNVRLENGVLQCTEAKPLINVENSKNLALTGVSAKVLPQVFLSVNGDRTGDIRLSGIDTSAAQDGISFHYGAQKSSVSISK